MIFLNPQMDFLHFLAQFRSPVINSFFYFLNFFDSDFFEIFLVLFVWIGCSRKWGIRLGLLLSLNGLVNYTAKQILAMPRPFHFDPHLAMVDASRFGCPSGGAQLSALLGLLIMTFWKHRWAPILGLFYLCMISFSRLFLGVHFPIDILGGWSLAFAVFLLFKKYSPSIETICLSRPLVPIFITIGAGIVITSISPYPKTIYFTSIAASIAIGAYLTRHRSPLPSPPPMLNMIWSGLGISIAIALGYFIQVMPLPFSIMAFIQTSIVCLWTAFIADHPAKEKFLYRFA